MEQIIKGLAINGTLKDSKNWQDVQRQVKLHPWKLQKIFDYRNGIGNNISY